MAYTLKPAAGCGWYVFENKTCGAFCFTFWGAKWWIRRRKSKLARAAAFNTRSS